MGIRLQDRKMKTLLPLLLLVAACSVGRAARLPREVKCMDAQKEAWCATRKEQGLCTKDPYTIAFCQKTCQLCDKCLDAANDLKTCIIMKILSRNCTNQDKFGAFARSFCQKSCGICSKCFDAEATEDCKRKQEYGSCEADPLARAFCKKTCGYCS